MSVVVDNSGSLESVHIVRFAFSTATSQSTSLQVREGHGLVDRSIIPPLLLNV